MGQQEREVQLMINLWGSRLRTREMIEGEEVKDAI